MHTGEVLDTDIARSTSVSSIECLEGIKFLEDSDVNVAPSLAIHGIVDNRGSHTSNATTAWLADHPALVVHDPPRHARSANHVGLFFSIGTRTVLRRGHFSSREDMVSPAMLFLTSESATAEPFNWTHPGRPPKVAS